MARPALNLLVREPRSVCLLESNVVKNLPGKVGIASTGYDQVNAFDTLERWDACESCNKHADVDVPNIQLTKFQPTEQTKRHHTVLPSHHVSPCITLYHHVPPCITLYHHVSPCITLYHHVSPCITMYHLVSPCTTMYHLHLYIMLTKPLLYIISFCATVILPKVGDLFLVWQTESLVQSTDFFCFTQTQTEPTRLLERQ